MVDVAPASTADGAWTAAAIVSVTMMVALLACGVMSYLLVSRRIKGWPALPPCDALAGEDCTSCGGGGEVRVMDGTVRCSRCGGSGAVRTALFTGWWM